MRIFIPLIASVFAGLNPKEAEGSLSKFDDIYNGFGWETLFSNVKSRYHNAVISPLSVLGGMFMLAAGTRGVGKQEIFDSLYLGDTENPLEAYRVVANGLLNNKFDTYDLNIANAVFHQKTLNSTTAYHEDIQKYFGGNFHKVDFGEPEAATNQINKWVSDQTHEKIPKLFENPLAEDTAMVLASSLYFKSNWHTQFTPYPEDGELCWYIDQQATYNGECLEGVSYMQATTDVYYRNMDMGEVIEIPFKTSKDGAVNNKLNFQLWYPHTFITNDEDDEKFRKFIKENIGTVRYDPSLPIGKRNMKKRRLFLIMPKFKLDFSADIRDSLRLQGIESVFTDNADFSPIVGEEFGRAVKLTGVDHAVRFELDEHGVEGAAVTAVTGSFRSARISTTKEINRPFYFAITNRCWDNKLRRQWVCPYQNIPIFVGRVVNPLSD